ncbi:phosphopantetheine-binding protein [Xanthomonas hydrangeae]|uniref:Phosphopantetheine-binding protein n=1 Tax=Xanthomonas hydrangeae TaxID=2775159 RepID=A0AAU0B7D3_9XANT|nr:phosphopantetheine-binding protein [Xanthomonas hydrangeae]WOB47927.1 phosphopantetheine-binding protein [Xanthomonas hydrangeae]
METTERTTLELLARELEKITDSERCPVDVSLTELGVDSINIIEMIVFCESLYGAFDPEKIEINNFTTLEGLDRQLTALTVPVVA